MRRLLIVAALLLASSLGFGQGVRYQNVVLFHAGFSHPNIRVCTEPATGSPCTPLASIFSDAAMTQPLSNPFTGDANGNFAFYANPATKYHVRVSGVGITPYDIPDISLPSSTGGGGGGGTFIQVNGSQVPGTSANFNANTPAIPANNLPVTFQRDSNGTTTSISAYVPYAATNQLGVVQLTSDLCGTATAPQVCSAHPASPWPVAIGGTGATTKAAGFNNLAPDTAIGGLLVGSGVNQYSNLPIGGNGTALISNGTTAAWGAVSTTGVQFAPGVGANQLVLQQNGTTLGANSFENTIYAENMVWTFSPVSPASISIGSNTVTLTTCPLGVNAANPDHYVLIGGTGVQEAAKITGGTCTSGLAGGTITFTAVGAHAAGYTVGTASGGLKEASEYAKAAVTNPTGNLQNGRVALKGNSEVHAFAPIYFESSNQTIDLSGTVVECNMVNVPCIHLGNDTNVNSYEHMTITNPRCRAMVTSTAACLEDNAMHSRIMGLAPRNALSFGNGHTGSFGKLIQIDNDQAALVDGLDTGLGSWTDGVCSSDPCPVAISGPGPFNPNAGVIWVKNSNISLGCVGNGIDNADGNTLHVSDSVIQGYSQFAIRSQAAFGVNPAFQATNVYTEVGSCTNPTGTGVAGYILQGGFADVTGGEGPVASLPVYSNTGTSVFYSYYIVGHSTTMGDSAPFLAGGSKLSGATGTYAVKWYQFGTAGSITYDVVRVSSTAATNSVAPYTAVCGGGSPSNCGSVAAGLVQATVCTNNVCSFTDDASAVTTPYTVATLTSYYPALTQWPGTYVITDKADNQTNPGGYVNVDKGPSGAVSSHGVTSPSVFARRCSQQGSWSSIWMNCPEGDNVGNNFLPGGATLFRIGGTTGADAGGWKGRLNVLNTGNTTLGPQEVFTWGESNAPKTLATAGLRSTWDANDTALAYDQASSVAPALFQAAYMSPVSHSFYVGSLPDNVAWKFRIAVALATLKIPLTTNSNLTMTGGAFNVGAATSAIPWVLGTGVPNNATCITTGQGYFQTDGTAGQEVFYCKGGIWTQGAGGGGGTVNDQLSNLNVGGTAVNVSLIPGAAGTLSLGTAPLPWQRIFIGNTANQSVQLTSTPGANFVATLPGNTGTIAELNFAQTWTARQTLGSVQSSTASPATTGFIQMALTDAIRCGVANLNCLSMDAGSITQVGDVNGVKLAGNVTTTPAGTALSIQPASATGSGNGGDLTVSGGNGAGTGANGNLILAAGTGGTGTIGTVLLGSPLAFNSVPNDTVTGTVLNQLVSLTTGVTGGKAVQTPGGSVAGVVGVCVKNCNSTASPNPVVAYSGTVKLNLDNTPNPGDYVCISLTNGLGTGCGTNPASGQVIGNVVSFSSGTLWNVQLNIGVPNPSSVAGGALLLSGAGTQTAIPGCAACGFIFRSPSGAAPTFAFFQLQNQGGGLLFSMTDGGVGTFGTGTAGFVQATHYDACSTTTVTTAIVSTAGALRLCSTASEIAVGWLNNGGSANVTISKDSNDAVFLKNATNFVVPFLNNTVYCDQMAGGDLGAQINAATAAVAAGGTVSCLGIGTGSKPVTTNIVLNKPGVKYMFPPNVTLAFAITKNITCSSGTTGDNIDFGGSGDSTILDFTAETGTVQSIPCLNVSGTSWHDFKVNGPRLSKDHSGGVAGATTFRFGIAAPSTVSRNRIYNVTILNSGNVAVNVDNCSFCEVTHNYIQQSWGDAILINSSQTTIAGVLGTDVGFNTIIDAATGCTASGCGDGNINVISNGGTGALSGTRVHDNKIYGGVVNAVAGVLGATCTDVGTGQGVLDTQCGQGIQVVYDAGWPAYVDQNIVVNTHNEGIATGGSGTANGNYLKFNACTPSSCTGGAGGIAHYTYPGIGQQPITSIVGSGTVATLVTTHGLNCPDGSAVNCGVGPQSVTKIGGYVRIAGTSSVFDGTWRLLTVGDATGSSTYTFAHSSATSIGAVGTATNTGVARDFQMTGNVAEDDGYCYSLQVGMNNAKDGQGSPQPVVMTSRASYDGILVGDNVCRGTQATVATGVRFVDNCNGSGALNCTLGSTADSSVVFSSITMAGLVTKPLLLDTNITGDPTLRGVIADGVLSKKLTLTGQTANIGATNMLTAPIAAGSKPLMFGIKYYLNSTASCGAGAGPATITLQFQWNDGISSKQSTAVVLALGVTTGASHAEGFIPAFVSTGNVQYVTTAYQNCTSGGTATYALRVSASLVD